MLKTPLPIGEVAQLFELRASTLRYYEDLSLLKPSSRQGGRRFYDVPELKRLALIRLLQDACHLSLDEIAEVLGSESDDRTRSILGNQVAALERQIAAARSAKKYLEHRLSCPRQDPVQECPVLDRHVSGWLSQRLRAATSEQPAKAIAAADVREKDARSPRSKPRKPSAPKGGGSTDR